MVIKDGAYFRSVIQSGPSERKPNKGGCLFCAGSSLSAIFSRQSSERMLRLASASSERAF